MKPQNVIRIVAILGSAILAASRTEADGQGVLFSQPFDETGNFTSSTPYAVYDDFTLPSGGKINQVNWSGLDEGGLKGFTVSIWSDKGGLPGTLLASDNITGLAGEKASGNVYLDSPGSPIYNYSATLGSPFSAAPETEYFLSIVGTGDNGCWCWETSAVGNTGILQYQDVLGYNPIQKDAGMAFTLETVPEPSTIALGLFGALAFLFRRVSSASPA